MNKQVSKFFSEMNKKGIPIPLARDPQTGLGSLTFTMTVVAFAICVILLAGKLTNLIGNVDYDNALWLLGLTLSTYLGRQYQKNGQQMAIGEISISQNKKDQPEIEDDTNASK